MRLPQHTAAARARHQPMADSYALATGLICIPLQCLHVLHKLRYSYRIASYRVKPPSAAESTEFIQMRANVCKVRLSPKRSCRSMADWYAAAACCGGRPDDGCRRCYFLREKLMLAAGAYPWRP